MKDNNQLLLKIDSILLELSRHADTCPNCRLKNVLKLIGDNGK